MQPHIIYPCGQMSYFVIFTVTWFSECSFAESGDEVTKEVKSIILMLDIGLLSDGVQDFCGESFC